jgi:uncharacterized protein (DUF1684 family)
LYTWLNKQGVRSSLGFTVQTTGRFSIEYRDEKGVVIVDVEFAPGPPTTTCAYQRRCFNALPEAHQRVAIDNFRDALEFMGLEPIEYAT